jgi:hypothetical protein
MEKSSVHEKVDALLYIRIGHNIEELRIILKS